MLFLSSAHGSMDNKSLFLVSIPVAEAHLTLNTCLQNLKQILRSAFVCVCVCACVRACMWGGVFKEEKKDLGFG